MRVALPILIALAIVAGCSKGPDLEGQWKNSDNATIAFKPDSVAVMGQEGIDGETKGTYWTRDDTVWVKSEPEGAGGMEMYNVFTFYQTMDTLFLERISLHRGDNSQSLDADEFGGQLGKSRHELAFIRTKQP